MGLDSALTALLADAVGARPPGQLGPDAGRGHRQGRPPASPPRPRPTGGVPAATPGPDRAAPRGDLRLRMWEQKLQEPEHQEGVSRLLEGLQGRLFPLPDATRVGVNRLTDVEPVQQQYERWQSIVPPLAPKPGELLTPRESEVLRQLYRKPGTPTRAGGAGHRAARRSALKKRPTGGFVKKGVAIQEDREGTIAPLRSGAEQRKMPVGRPFPPGVSGNPSGRPRGLSGLARAEPRREAAD